MTKQNGKRLLCCGVFFYPNLALLFLNRCSVKSLSRESFALSTIYAEIQNISRHDSNFMLCFKFDLQETRALNLLAVCASRQKREFSVGFYLFLT